MPLPSLWTKPNRISCPKELQNILFSPSQLGNQGNGSFVQIRNHLTNQSNSYLPPDYYIYRYLKYKKFAIHSVRLNLRTKSVVLKKVYKPNITFFTKFQVKALLAINIRDTKNALFRTWFTISKSFHMHHSRVSLGFLNPKVKM